MSHMARPAGSKKLLIACAAGIVFAYAASLAILFASHQWLLDGQGRPLVVDFLAVWSAGKLVLGGAALSAYDAQLQHAGEVAVLGHEFKGALGWPYPPFFLFMAAGLASLGYAWAFAVWAGATMAGYAATVGAIAKSRTAILFALAAPWTLATLFVGQNGFLTAALIGLVLLNLKRLPILSGILLGLLTYKPQFGLLFPLALAMGGHWRAFVMACLTALTLIALSNAVFGPGAFAAFLHVLPQTA
ncbi:MAG TPA: glycosyltransferase family 87 protein, partial [Rhizomicrobium sp.]